MKVTKKKAEKVTETDIERERARKSGREPYLIENRVFSDVGLFEAHTQTHATLIQSIKSRNYQNCTQDAFLSVSCLFSHIDTEKKHNSNSVCLFLYNSIMFCQWHRGYMYVECCVCFFISLFIFVCSFLFLRLVLLLILGYPSFSLRQDLY